MQEKTSSRFRKVKDSEQLQVGDMILNQKYELTQQIGKGSFGEVFRGLFTDKQKSKKKYPKQVAVKVQNDPSHISQIANEVTILCALHQNIKNRNNFPRLYSSGVESGRMFMIMDLLGPNLADLMVVCGGKFSIKTSILLTIQIIERIETLHSIGYLYRDIKPQNFLMGLGKDSKNVYLVDFGLCKKYRDNTTKLLVPYKEGTSMVGTIRYSSLNSHLGIDQSRRDDLQSIVYMLVYFIKGELPWQGMGAEHKYEKDQMILNLKLKLTGEQLCEDLPEEIENVFQYVKNLGFYQDPDYHFILTELSYVLEGESGDHKYEYDWEKREEEGRLEKTYLDLVIGNGKNQSLIEEEKDSEDSEYNVVITPNKSGFCQENIMNDEI